MMASHNLLEVLNGVKVLAREYYELTGRPLGVTAEIAEYEAARLLKLTLSPARQAGYDATARRQTANSCCRSRDGASSRARTPASASARLTRRNSGMPCYSCYSIASTSHRDLRS